MYQKSLKMCVVLAPGSLRDVFWEMHTWWQLTTPPPTVGAPMVTQKLSLAISAFISPLLNSTDDEKDVTPLNNSEALNIMEGSAKFDPCINFSLKLQNWSTFQATQDPKSTWFVMTLRICRRHCTADLMHLCFFSTSQFQISKKHSKKKP